LELPRRCCPLRHQAARNGWFGWHSAPEHRLWHSPSYTEVSETRGRRDMGPRLQVQTILLSNPRMSERESLSKHAGVRMAATDPTGTWRFWQNRCDQKGDRQNKTEIQPGSPWPAKSAVPYWIEPIPDASEQHPLSSRYHHTHSGINRCIYKRMHQNFLEPNSPVSIVESSASKLREFLFAAGSINLDSEVGTLVWQCQGRLCEPSR
jgi:hypothetical protein